MVKIENLIKSRETLNETLIEKQAKKAHTTIVFLKNIVDEKDENFQKE